MPRYHVHSPSLPQRYPARILHSDARRLDFVTGNRRNGFGVADGAHGHDMHGNLCKYHEGQNGGHHSYLSQRICLSLFVRTDLDVA